MQLLRSPSIPTGLWTIVCFGSGMEAPLSRRYYEAIHSRYMDKINRLMAEHRAKPYGQRDL